MPNMKKYLITAITLGVIAAGSACLIGLTNLATKDKIAANEQKRIQAGIAELFGEDSVIKEENPIDGYKYANYIYTIGNSDDTLNAVAVRTTGSNEYGKISLLVGIRYVSGSQKFEAISVISNEQTYASTLEENYIIPVNGGSREYTDVSCGATYGAKLIEAMIEDAISASARIY